MGPEPTFFDSEVNALSTVPYNSTMDIFYSNNKHSWLDYSSLFYVSFYINNQRIKQFLLLLHQGILYRLNILMWDTLLEKNYYGTLFYLIKCFNGQQTNKAQWDLVVSLSFNVTIEM